jgi:hypothetical protein
VVSYVYVHLENIKAHVNTFLNKVGTEENEGCEGFLLSHNHTQAVNENKTQTELCTYTSICKSNPYSGTKIFTQPFLVNLKSQVPDFFFFF